MTKHKKIFLSLDDLHKLYGISPETVRRIKQKKRKRKAKAKKQVQTGVQMGGQASKSNMMGSNSFNRTNDNILEQAKIEKHMSLINEENKRITEANRPLAIEDAPQPPPPRLQAPLTPLHDTFRQMADHMESGRAKGKVNKTGFSLNYPERRSKTRISKKDRVEELDAVIDPVIDPVIERVQPKLPKKTKPKLRIVPGPYDDDVDDDPYDDPYDESYEAGNPLSNNVGSNNMNREPVHAILFADDGQDYGMEGFNGGSDDFQADDVDDGPPPLEPIVRPPEQEELPPVQDELPPIVAEPEPVEQPRRGRKKKEQKAVGGYSKTEIRQLAASKGIAYDEKETILSIYHKIFPWIPPGVNPKL